MQWSGGRQNPWQVLRQNGDALGAAAREILAAIPEAQLVGLIVAPGAPRGDELRRILAQCRVASDPDRLSMGLVPRELATPVLHDGFAAGASAFAVLRVPQTRLPIVVATSAGAAVGSVPCGVDGAVA